MVRHVRPSGERRRIGSSRRLGNYPLERRSACSPTARRMYSFDEGPH